MEPNEVPGLPVIYITGEIDQEAMNGWAVTLTELKSPRKVVLMINSSGGSTAAAIGFCNIIRHVLAITEVETVCLGVVASAAVPIFMLGKQRTMMPQSHLLLHRSSAHHDGTTIPAAQLDSMAAQCRLLDWQAAELISAGCGGKINAKQVMILMQEERLLTPEEALKMGLATNVYSQDARKDPKPDD